MTIRKVALYEDSRTLERARVLDDSVLSAYNESVTSAYNDLRAQEILKKFGSVNGELVGSNIPMLIHLQESGLLGGSRLATRCDLETVKRCDLNLSGNCADLGVALREENLSYSPNKTSATNLVSQLNQRGIKLGKGRLISLSALTQKEDAGSSYGLILSLKDDIFAKDIPLLNEFKWSWTNREDIARTFFFRGADWGWADSDGNGRVIVISTENSS